MADSQILRTIRAVRKRTVDPVKLERLYAEKELLHRRCMKKKHDPWYAVRLKQIRDKIYRTMYIPDYVTVVMEHKSHYDHIFEHGFEINGNRYVRLSCSAGQARLNTVVFCCEDIAGEVKRRLNNDRDLSKKIAPSKFNAYFGLAGSATHRVSEPRFVVVKDFINTSTFMAHFDTETEWTKDDMIDTREVTAEMNRTDGMGLISPAQAEKWAKEMGLSHIPSQFCVRQAFLKGMLCVFPFHEFCEEINGGDYIIDTVYTDKNGNPVRVDLRDYDVIVTESQFKLWDSWPSAEEYVRCCHRNGLYWGVTQYAPETAKDVLTLNYQFIQTLDLDKRGAERLCEPFIRWIEGITMEKPDEMLLFLLGPNNTRESIRRFLKSDDKWWIKALIANPECAKDPYIRSKIRDLARNRIKSACMGEIIVPGNFQVLVSDPYAMMEHVCGMEPKGLLGPGEYYSNYWNERGVTTVDTMRSPMTYRCEHVVAKLIRNERTEKWYRYCKLGFLVNWYGHETVNWAGSDWDYDIIATTSNKTMIDGVYPDELTVTYDAPKPKKIIFDEKDLFEADKFSFGSIIGSITNKSTNAYALLPLIEEEYGKDSEEARLIVSRLQQCCVAQSRAIDKTKIGQPVKGIPDVWIRRQRIEEGDSEELKKQKELLNRCVIGRKPYFFRHRYADSKKEHDSYRKSRDVVCQSLFGLTLEELLNAPRKTQAQKDWLKNYYEFSPLVESDSPMNLVCRQIEGVDFEITEKFRNEKTWNPEVYLSETVEGWMDYYPEVTKCYDRYLRDVVSARVQSSVPFDKERAVTKLRESLSFICSNPVIVANCLVRYLLIDKPRKDLELFWAAYGRELVRAAAQKNAGVLMFPFPERDGDIEYLGKKYRRFPVDDVFWSLPYHFRMERLWDKTHGKVSKEAHGQVFREDDKY